jgi:GT2 family glycosyltransferase
VICPDGLSIGRGRLEPEDRYQEEAEVLFGSGCAFLSRREILNDIGLYGEDFFAYPEDTDIGWRSRAVGTCWWGRDEENHGWDKANGAATD